MKIVFAPDKYKSCMTAPEVCAALDRAFRTVFPGADLVSLPMADGGDGTVEAILAAAGADGIRRKVSVTGPLGARTEAVFGLVGNGSTAVLEMASASGIALLSPSELDPRRATTYGTGELIRHALDSGAREILIGIGGSATVDGGAGMAQALGYRLLDEEGRELPPGGAPLARLAKIDPSGADPRIFRTRFRIACDVTSPLLGPAGAARVFGPQKGADPACVEELEHALANLAACWKSSGLLPDPDRPGDGAAGGLGAGLRAFCKAVPGSGAELIMDTLHFSEHLKGASLVVTGEGRTDSQTGAGKLCGAVAEAAHAAGVPVLLLSGALDGRPEDFYPVFDFAFSISPGRTSLADALKNGPADLYAFALNLARLMRESARIGGTLS